jgi:three-Cys-motif partner protein
MGENFFDEQSEQSQIKAAIVTDYFWAWAGFMVAQQKLRPQYGDKLQYIDLFAGPGRYQSGAKSTPLMIIERAVNDPEISARLLFQLQPHKHGARQRSGRGAHRCAVRQRTCRQAA